MTYEASMSIFKYILVISKLYYLYLYLLYYPLIYLLYLAVFDRTRTNSE